VEIYYHFLSILIFVLIIIQLIFIVCKGDMQVILYLVFFIEEQNVISKDDYE